VVPTLVVSGLASRLLFVLFLSWVSEKTSSRQLGE
jgi:hypothetical protein